MRSQLCAFRAQAFWEPSTQHPPFPRTSGSPLGGLELAENQFRITADVRGGSGFPVQRKPHMEARGEDAEWKAEPAGHVLSCRQSGCCVASGRQLPSLCLCVLLRATMELVPL